MPHDLLSKEIGKPVQPLFYWEKASEYNLPRQNSGLLSSYYILLAIIDVGRVTSQRAPELLCGRSVKRETMEIDSHHRPNPPWRLSQAVLLPHTHVPPLRPIQGSSPVIASQIYTRASF